MTLDVYYDSRGKDLDAEDACAEAAAGKPAQEKNTNSCEARHLVFAFAAAHDLQAAKQRLKDDGFRFFP